MSLPLAAVRNTLAKISAFLVPGLTSTWFYMKLQTPFISALYLLLSIIVMKNDAEKENRESKLITSEILFEWKCHSTQLNHFYIVIFSNFCSAYMAAMVYNNEHNHNNNHNNKIASYVHKQTITSSRLSCTWLGSWIHNRWKMRWSYNFHIFRSTSTVWFWLLQSCVR